MCVSVPMTPSTLLMPVGDDVGKRLVLAHPDHRDEVGGAGDGVDLTHPVEVSNRLRDLGDAVDRGMDQDDGGDHGGQAIRRCG